MRSSFAQTGIELVRGVKYVALGDSAAAAPPVPDAADPPGCFKSTNDYPAVLAPRIGAPDDRYVEGFELSHLAASLHPNALGAGAVGNALAGQLKLSDGPVAPARSN